ncbi:MAG TPA: hypothetical protein VMT69_14040 [Kineosporiaceae bacterium]|nr:hypothetical protein [Kineosporiaceae bacterium]
MRTTPHTLGIRFYLYGSACLPLVAMAERVTAAVQLPLGRRVSSVRGTYFRWSGDHGADIVVQANVADEDGRLVEADHPVHGVLVYATGLPEASYQALDEVDGLELLVGETVLVT